MISARRPRLRRSCPGGRPARWPLGFAASRGNVLAGCGAWRPRTRRCRRGCLSKALKGDCFGLRLSRGYLRYNVIHTHIYIYICIFVRIVRRKIRIMMITKQINNSNNDTYIYMLLCSVFTPPPPWYGPMKPCHPHSYCFCPVIRLLAFYICLLFPHLVEILANNIGFDTTHKDYDSMNQHSHPSTLTTGPQGGANHDHARGRTLDRASIHTYIYMHSRALRFVGPHFSCSPSPLS